MAGAGSRYVEITIEEMEKFLETAFHALRPRKGTGRGGQYIFDLSVSDNHAIFIRIYTTIFPRSGLNRQLGADSIKVTLLSDKDKALEKSLPIVQRTKNWRSAVQDRVEEYLEMYESAVEDYKARRLRGEPGRNKDLDQALEKSLSPAERRELDDAEEEIRQERENSEEEAPRGPGVRKTKPAKPKDQPAFTAEFRNIGFSDNHDKVWGIKINVPGTPGLEGVAETSGGRKTKVRLKTRLRKFPDGEVWTFDEINGKRVQPPVAYPAFKFDVSVEELARKVAERFLKASA